MDIAKQIAASSCCAWPPLTFHALHLIGIEVPLLVAPSDDACCVFTQRCDRLSAELCNLLALADAHERSIRAA